MWCPPGDPGLLVDWGQRAPRQARRPLWHSKLLTANHVGTLGLRVQMAAIGRRRKIRDRGLSSALSAPPPPRAEPERRTTARRVPRRAVSRGPSAPGAEGAQSGALEERPVAECPHGNPIPGSRRRVEHRADVQLDRADPGPVTIARVSEKIELDDAALQLLATARLIPGSKAVIVGRDSDGVRVATGSGEQLVP